MGNIARAVLCVVVFAGCASSKRAAEIDAGDGSAEADAPIAVDAMIDADLADFGDPCTDSNQCDSHLCIAAGSGGVCSKLCGMCPDGWGCFGVLGAIDPGQVAFVCVPTSTQLCSPCQADTECTLIGMDKCLTEATGRRYCGRDCSTVSCPTGYDCTTETIGTATYHECTPHSGACDCQSAAQQGMMDTCSITTLLNTQCTGASTCNGATGWGACQPPSAVDSPDATYADSNCDGIDGEYVKGIFVAGAGVNSATCGLTHTTPCQTISFGIVRGVQTSRPNVYVQAGNYSEVVVLLNGVNVWGGFDFNWQRGPYSNTANRVTITGGQDTTAGGDNEYLTVRAHDLIVPVTMADLVLQGPTAQGVGGASGRDGRSSYVVHAKAAMVTLSRVQIVAGMGASGAAGTTGADAVIADAQGQMFGGNGGNGDQYVTTCNSSSRGGAGGAGTNSCSQSPSSRPMNGGPGGQGGTMDTNCSVFSLNYNARAGSNGTPANYQNGNFGLEGLGGSGGGSCGPTSDGIQGFVQNGAAGGAVSGGYLGGVNNLYWYARAGNPGGTGENGGGGGGGGGSGGCDGGTDAYGPGGGGGGAGGCAARGGGGGGGGGGGAFGIVAVGMSTVSVDSCSLTRGVANGGGGGGAGGRGQSGGGRGVGGSNPGSAFPGAGGVGGHGGHGGGGAGGQGGRSVGILNTSDSSILGTCSQSGGGAGSGGSGGASAPNAPAAERDGNNGGTGGSGTLEPTRTCGSTSSC